MAQSDYAVASEHTQWARMVQYLRYIMHGARAALPAAQVSLDRSRAGHMALCVLYCRARPQLLC